MSFVLCAVLRHGIGKMEHVDFVVFFYIAAKEKRFTFISFKKHNTIEIPTGVRKAGNDSQVKCIDQDSPALLNNVRLGYREVKPHGSIFGNIVEP